MFSARAPAAITSAPLHAQRLHVETSPFGFAGTEGNGHLSDVLGSRVGLRFQQVDSTWRGIKRVSRNARTLRPDLPDADVDSLREQMRDCLAGRGGEVSARGRAAALGEAYLGLSDVGRRRFLELLAGEFAVDHEALLQELTGLHDEDDLQRRLAAQARLREIRKNSGAGEVNLEYYRKHQESQIQQARLRRDFAEAAQHIGSSLDLEDIKARLMAALKRYYPKAKIALAGGAQHLGPP